MVAAVGVAVSAGPSGRPLPLLVGLLSDGEQAVALLGAVQTLEVVVAEHSTAGGLVKRVFVLRHAASEVLDEGEAPAGHPVDTEAARHGLRPAVREVE